MKHRQSSRYSVEPLQVFIIPNNFALRAYERRFLPERYEVEHPLGHITSPCNGPSKGSDFSRNEENNGGLITTVYEHRAWDEQGSLLPLECLFHEIKYVDSTDVVAIDTE
ncbi:1796_t:CDS:2, partial [Rhizophagus irregularis]